MSSVVGVTCKRCASSHRGRLVLSRMDWNGCSGDTCENKDEGTSTASTGATATSGLFGSLWRTVYNMAASGKVKAWRSLLENNPVLPLAWDRQRGPPSDSAPFAISINSIEGIKKPEVRAMKYAFALVVGRPIAKALNQWIINNNRLTSACMIPYSTRCFYTQSHISYRSAGLWLNIIMRTCSNPELLHVKWHVVCQKK